MNAGQQIARDINWLYHQIHIDSNHLDQIDAQPFVHTHLHTIAALPHDIRLEDIRLAMEIMRLKPSFAWKLNQDGFSPIHIAIQNGHRTLVDRFIDINQDLVRVKGKEGITPLHLVAQRGDAAANADLLASFLSACPNSIQDVTVQSETALHIALKHGQITALKVLVGWLRINHSSGAADLQKRILNWKDEEGNNILHKAVQLNNEEAVEFLISTEMEINMKNLSNSTALDICENMISQGVYVGRIKWMLERAKALRGVKIGNYSYAQKLIGEITNVDRIAIKILRLRGNLTDETRNILLVVAAFIATLSYQAVLSPPGGLYQADADVDSTPPTAAPAPASGLTPIADTSKAGKSVMNRYVFMVYWLYITVGLLGSILTIFFALPSKGIGRWLHLPLLYCVYGYTLSMLIISPSSVDFGLSLALFIVAGILYTGSFLAARVFDKLASCREKWETELRRSGDKNKW